MDAVAGAQSVQAVNQVLQLASQATLEHAQKLTKMTVEMAVGAESGKGSAVDVRA